MLIKITKILCSVKPNTNIALMALQPILEISKYIDIPFILLLLLPLRNKFGKSGFLSLKSKRKDRF